MRWIVLTGLAAGILLGGCSQPDEQAFKAALHRMEFASSTGDRDQRTDSPTAVPWFEFGEALAQATRPADAPRQSDPDDLAAPKRAYVPYAERRGPAYPGDFWRSFGRDAKEFAPMMLEDSVAVVTDPFGVTMLAAAGVTGIALSGNRGNDQVERHFSRNSSQLNTFWDVVGDVGGNPGLHFAIAGSLYLTSLARGDDKNYEAAKSMLSALAINGLTTMALKVMARTASPNGDEFGWPSGHTSSSFAFAAVVSEHYGPWVGVPLYVFAAYVGYERIDARNHDFADVISGALIGMAIGHVVGGRHQLRVLEMDVLPYTDPRGGVGLALYKRW